MSQLAHSGGRNRNIILKNPGRHLIYSIVRKRDAFHLTSKVPDMRALGAIISLWPSGDILDEYLCSESIQPTEDTIPEENETSEDSTEESFRCDSMSSCGFFTCVLNIVKL